MNIKQWLPVVVAILVAGLVASAQISSTGSVMGYVKDENGKPVVGAQVVFQNLDTGRSLTMKTDKSGQYFGANLSSGKYRITLTISGQEIAKREVSVQGGLYGDPNSLNSFRNKGGDYDFQLQKKSEGGAADQESAKAKAGYERAAALNREGKYEEALAELQPLAEKESTQWVVPWQMAVAYAGLNRNEEAEAAFKKAIALAPTDARLYNELGRLYMKTKRMEEARTQFETAANLSPEDAPIFWYNLAVTFYNQGDMKSALEPLAKVVELDPGHANAHFYLGVCLYGTAPSRVEGGQVKVELPPGTREHFETYLALAPDGPLADQAKAFLQQIDTTVPSAVRSRKK